MSRAPGIRSGRLPLALGTVAFLLYIVLLPFAGTGEFSYTGQITAFALAATLICVILHGFTAATRAIATPRLLLLGCAAAIAGFASAYLARPEALADELLPALPALFLADILRLFAAASLGISLARHVSSAGVALLIAGVATVADLFSVFAGPTGALLREDSPALDFLLLIFPAFGQPLGFALGLSDFIFLALFAAMSLFLRLHYAATLLCGAAAILLAMTTGLLLERPLPALPFYLPRLRARQRGPDLQIPPQTKPKPSVTFPQC